MTTTYRLDHADAKQWLTQQPDNSVDFFLTDPPYNLTRLGYENDWVWHADSFAFWWQQVERITKPNAWVAMFAVNPFGARLICSNLDAFSYSYTWVKSRKSSPLNSSWRPLGQHEDVHMFCMGGAKSATYNPQMFDADALWNGSPARGVGKQWGEFTFDAWVETGKRKPVTALYFPSPKRVYYDDATHPSQKPVELLEHLIATHSNPGDTIGDSFAGSASSGIAAAKQGRSYLACEKSAHWAERGNKSLAWQYSQEPLFFEGHDNYAD